MSSRGEPRVLTLSGYETRLELKRRAEGPHSVPGEVNLPELPTAVQVADGVDGVATQHQSLESAARAQSLNRSYSRGMKYRCPLYVYVYVYRVMQHNILLLLQRVLQELQTGKPTHLFPSQRDPGTQPLPEGRTSAFLEPSKRKRSDLAPCAPNEPHPPNIQQCVRGHMCRSGSMLLSV